MVKKVKDIQAKTKPKISSVKPATKDHHAPKHQLSWQAKEFRYYEKDRFWILGIGALLLGFMLGFIFLGQYLTAVVCLLIGVVLYQHGYAKPEEHKVELTVNGVLFRGKEYSYTQLKSFWLVEEPEKKLYFEVTGFSFPITVLLEDQSVEEIRSFLSRYLPEHPTATELVTDRFARFLRF